MSTQESAKTYYQKNKGKFKKYYQKNKENILARTKERAAQKKEEIKEYSKQYYQDNKERVLEAAAKYRKKNRKKIRLKARKAEQDARVNILDRYVKGFLQEKSCLPPVIHFMRALLKFKRSIRLFSAGKFQWEGEKDFLKKKNEVIQAAKLFIKEVELGDGHVYNKAD